MEFAAAIDLLDGRARRLVGGDYARPIEASADPLELARGWLAAGVPRLHVVDLDGARLGQPVHLDVVVELARVRAEIAPAAKLEVGGGLRSEAAVAAVIDAGGDEVILGTAALADRAFLARCAARWPRRIGVSLDVRAGRPAVDGWTRDLADDPFALAGRLLEAGAFRLVITAVERDGTASGPALDLLAAFRRRFPDALLVAAGGIARADDLAQLAELGLDGAIVGRALLDRSLDVGEALAACGGGVRL
ncbi:MAG: 1-(5-phosphoribosyl)-5-[(5-phosphoribosylamino)methylideneamino] imidazole-4-carboxamide isomerase [Chloroflexota bacterium]|nr:1-(5-phosphoribosyl)-5-[(5-phosphoribosylamino)methylideneamino] imidazole-4-carboxamide isomerase [Chloroflexota bacterium]